MDADMIVAALQSAGKQDRHEFATAVATETGLVPQNPVVRISWQAVMDIVYDMLLEAGIDWRALPAGQFTCLFQYDLEALTKIESWPVQENVWGLLGSIKKKAAVADSHLESQYEDKSDVEPYEPTDDFFPDDDVFFNGSFD